MILCFEQGELRSFLRFVLDVNSSGAPYPDNDIYLECIETFPEYRNLGFGTIILNGLFAIALQDNHGIYAKTSKKRWFKNRGFHYNGTENTFTISYMQIKFDNSVINRISYGEITPIGIVFPPKKL
jgi:hypothetical protein